jgi:hypothetical protein
VAEFSGFRCDGCGGIYEMAVRTRATMTFTGLVPLGTFERELCPQCAEPPTDMRPVKKRKARKGVAHEPGVPTQDTD